MIKEGGMTEEAKITRLWSVFRRLSEQDKTLVLKFIGVIPQKLKPGNRSDPAKNPKSEEDKKQYAPRV
jgi:hypothetical protein